MAEGKSASWDLPKWVKTKAWKIISTGDRKFLLTKYVLTMASYAC